MAHALQERYGTMVDIKLRNTLITRDNVIFNSRYEGNPKAGKVKIPVRDTEATVGDYNKATGAAANSSSTSYQDLSIDQDKYVNEIIDGYDASAVPDGIVAERLDSAGYELSRVIDKYSINMLETTSGVNIDTSKAASTSSGAFKNVVDAGAYLGRKGVPMDGRWLIASPEFYALLLQDSSFIRQGDMAQRLLETGAIGMISGFAIYVSNNMMYEDTTAVTGKVTTTEFIAGHPNWCHRVMEWQVPVHLQDLAGSGKYIGASAVQGRKVYGAKISKPATVYIKRKEVTAT